MSGLFSMVASKIWQVITRFSRGLRSFLAKSKAFIRPFYQKFPFLVWIRVRIHLFFKRLRENIMLVINSRNNTKAIQAILNRRFSRFQSSSIAQAQPVIDVSVVTFNSGKWIDGFFESLRAQNYPLSKLNMFFVDNGSSDSTLEALQRWQTLLGQEVAGFDIMEGDNVGFGAGHEKAIRKGRSEYFLVSNVDIVFAKDSITKVVAAALADAKAEVASWELRQAPYEHPKYYDPVTLETNWSSHACVLVRRSAYVEVGGYEREIFMYGEDVELSYRFRSYGYQLKYCPSAVVYHYTYEHEHHIKPIQYTGSTLANAYIRLRYGNLSDRVGGFILQCLLLLRPEPYAGARRDVFRNFGVIFKKARYFMRGKGPSENCYFPFRGFDYEMIRDGAFWEVGESLADYPLVTVVTRTYKNRGEFLRQSMMSVCNQTYPNIELIVVEDGGSTMSSVVSDFEFPEGMSVSYYSLDKVGRSVTGNYGLEKAAGKYCMFLDDDDLLFADHVEVLVGALAKNADAVAAYSLALEVGTVASGVEGQYFEVSHAVPPILKQEYDYEVLLDHNYIAIQSLLFQKDLFLQRGGFQTDMSSLEDWNLWLRYGYGNKFVYVPKTTSLFRTPGDPTVRVERHMQLHDAYYIAKNHALKTCKSYT
ncbi:MULTISPECIES: glycosyltransferase family 2 protein [Pseudomonas]|jgi:GT2 family glycosyltransferase|uniref:glycosyltransferase family 2 protein n=1 Tax=Pseudomonas TaxID=286 RepID=UPI000DAD2F10|nr:MULTISPECIES: glycosyltransferase family 2 protein [unclassified Pseudomonas]MBD9617419.1 glycosyltransferase [Pseudomonas sp. PDM07]PZW55639.1 GT2 family glycosyltransferase [Pseudomonas sp. URMO17WK12:I6]CAH0244690.1 N-acetylglucosaminyl-diphospho-decaprenol L-rhamnosyltransferase [Pseudomonas sp. Bi130]